MTTRLHSLACSPISSQSNLLYPFIHNAAVTRYNWKPISPWMPFFKRHCNPLNLFLRPTVALPSISSSPLCLQDIEVHFHQPPAGFIPPPLMCTHSGRILSYFLSLRHWRIVNTLYVLWYKACSFKLQSQVGHIWVEIVLTHWLLNRPWPVC